LYFGGYEVGRQRERGGIGVYGAYSLVWDGDGGESVREGRSIGIPPKKDILLAAEYMGMSCIKWTEKEPRYG
jgi:hypothetical protein